MKLSCKKARAHKEMRSLFNAWSLELKGYSGPVDIWHGDEDRILPLGMAQQMAKLIPTANLHVLTMKYYSLIIKRTAHILGQTYYDA